MNSGDARYTVTLLRLGEIVDYSSQWIILRDLYE